MVRRDSEVSPRRNERIGMSEQRIEYPPDHAIRVGFGKITEEALELSSRVGQSRAWGAESFCSPRIEGALKTLDDLRLEDGGKLTASERKGATYRSVSHVSRLWGMNVSERDDWFYYARHLGLSQRHIGHIIARTTGELVTAADDAITSARRRRGQALAASLEEGDRVSHESFGTGTVVEPKTRGMSPRRLLIRFDSDGAVRTLVPELAPMEKIQTMDIPF